MDRIFCEMACALEILHRSASPPSTTLVFPPETTQPVHVDAPPIFASPSRGANRTGIAIRHSRSVTPQDSRLALTLRIQPWFILCSAHPEKLAPPSLPPTANPVSQRELFSLASLFSPLSPFPRLLAPLHFATPLSPMPSAPPPPPSPCIHAVYTFSRGEGGGAFLVNSLASPRSLCVSRFLDSALELPNPQL